MSSSTTRVNDVREDGEDNNECDLTCNICKDLYQSCVTITICQHSFCSLCLRQNLWKQKQKTTKSQVTCPSCRTFLYSRSDPSSKISKLVRPNLEIQQRVYEYKKRQQHDTALMKTKNDDDENENDGRRSSRRLKAGQNGSSFCSNPKYYHQEEINNDPLTPMPSVFYNGKKRKDLIALLHEHGLPIQGSDSELRSRHERFVIYWNACCDEQVDPRTSFEVVQDFKEKERREQVTKSSLCFGRPASSTSTSSSKWNSQSFSKEFQNIYAKMFETNENDTTSLAEKWSKKNFALSIMAIQKHQLLRLQPSSELSALLDTLRKRAVDMDYNQPLLELLPKDYDITSLSTLTTNIKGAKCSGDGSSSASSNTSRHDDDFKPSAVPVSGTATTATPSKGTVASKRTENASLVTVSNSKKKLPKTFSAEPLSCRRLHTKDDGDDGDDEIMLSSLKRGSNSKILQETSKSLTSTTTSHNSVSSSSSNLDAMSHTTTATTSRHNKRSSSSYAVSSSSSFSAVVSATKKSRRTNSTDNTTTASKSTTRKNPTAKRSGGGTWKWNCQVCFEINHDPRSKICAHCNHQRGKTFDEVFNQQNNSSNNNNAVGSAASTSTPTHGAAASVNAPLPTSPPPSTSRSKSGNSVESPIALF